MVRKKLLSIIMMTAIFGSASISAIDQADSSSSINTEQIDTESLRPLSSTEDLTPKEQGLIAKLCETNEAFKKKIKELALNPQNKNKIRKFLWVSIAGLSIGSSAMYGNVEGDSQYRFIQLLLAQVVSKLLETYKDPIRNSALTPILSWILAIPLINFDIDFLYKNFKFITGWAVLSEFTAYSMAAYKAIDLLSWLKGKQKTPETKNDLKAFILETMARQKNPVAVDPTTSLSDLNLPIPQQRVINDNPDSPGSVSLVEKSFGSSGKSNHKTQ